MDFTYTVHKVTWRLKNHFLQFPVPWRIGICLLATIGVGSLNYRAGTDLALTIFYLVPIALAAWFIGAWAGYMFSIGSGLTWAIVDVLIARDYRHPTMHLWNGVASVILFVAFSAILTLLKRSLATERQLARVDHLTGIPNRRAFFEAAQ
jgi:predicted signal transduction protein with EAL and GGDEF domain